MTLLTKHSRNIYYVAMILLFFVLAPLVVFYVLGYRLDVSEGRIVQTGVLVLSSEPSRASVTLNGELRDQQTTARIDAVRTGMYTVTVGKKGYIPWEKQLAVLPGRSTIADAIVLFRETQKPEISLTGPQLTDGVALSRDRFLLISTTADASTLLYWFSEHDAPISLTTQPGTMEVLARNNSDHAVLLRMERNGFIRYAVGNLAPYIEAGSPPHDPMTLTALDTLMPQNPKRILWDARDSSVLWVLDENNLVTRIDLFDESATMDDEPAYDILATPEGILRLTEADSITHVQQEVRGTFHDLFTLPGTGYRLLAERNNVFVISNATETALYDIVKPGVLRKEAIGGTANGAQWQGQRYVLLTTAISVEAYDRVARSRISLGRFSDLPQDIMWYADNAYVAFAQSEHATIMELDPRDHRNGLQIDVTPGTHLLGFSADEKLAWFLSPASAETPGTLWAAQIR